IPGNRRSTIRHAMSSSRADPRRSSAEPNISTLNPSERSRLRIARRTDSSSSTIPMTRSSTGVASISATTVALAGAVYLLDLGVIRLRRRASRAPPLRRGRLVATRIRSSSSTTTTIRRVTVDRAAPTPHREGLPPPYLGIIPLRRCGSDPQPICLPHQVGHRGRVHLLHHLPAMDLDGHFAEAEVVCDLLVEQPRDDPAHHLTLTRGE